MKHLGIYPALLLLCFCSAAAKAIPGNAAHQRQFSEKNRHYIQYKNLVERVKKGEFGINFVELILEADAWAKSEKRSIEAPNRDAMVAAFEKKDYRDAVAKAEMVLDYEFSNISLHLATANAFKELAQADKDEFHTKVAQKLMDALISTGDGKSMETAYCILTTKDEYRIMQHFGYKVKMQLFATDPKTKSAFDILNGTDPKTGNDVGLIFDLDSFGKCVQKHQNKTTKR